MRCIYFVALSVILFFSPLVGEEHAQQIATFLNQLSTKDRDDLEFFLRELIEWDGFGFVIHGKKPMSFVIVNENIAECTTLRRFFYLINSKRRKFIRGYKLWRKYEPILSYSKYRMFYEPFPSGGILMTLINYQEFNEQLNTHPKELKKLLNRELTIETVMEESSSPLICGTLGFHDGVLGVFLGYGLENGLLCHQIKALKDPEKEAEFCKENGYSAVWSEEEFKQFPIKKDKSPWYAPKSKKQGLEFLALPSFGAKYDSNETLFWKEHYLEVKQEMIKRYENRDFLTTFLEALCS